MHDLARHRLVAVVQGVAPPELDRIDAQLTRDDVHVGLAGKHRLRVARRAHRAAGDAVGVDGLDLQAGHGHVVRRQRVMRRDHEPGRDLARGVGAAVDDALRLMRQELAVSIDRRAQRHARRVPRIGRLELVEVGHDGLDRPSRRPRQEVTHVLVDRQALAAEVAADEAGVDHDLRLGQTQRGRHLLSKPGWRLVGVDDAHRVLLVDPQHARAWLDEALELASGHERVLEDAVRLGEDVVDAGARLTLVDDGMTLDVRVRRRRSLRTQERVAVRVRMQDRRVGRERVVDTEDTGQVLVFDFDQARRGFGCLAGVGGDRGDPIADHAHAVNGQDGPVLQAAPETHRTDVRAGQNRMHARVVLGRGRVDRDDAGMRPRAAHVGQPQHAWQREVGRVARGAGDLEWAFDPVLGLVEQLLRGFGLEGQRHARASSRSCRRARSVQTRAMRRL